jgi:uncharacterized protein YecE (DUF72 family)
MAPGKHYIGTSGWVYTHWQGLFYPAKTPAKDLLQYYAGEFRTAEINNSFYKLPTLDTYRSWAEQVPEDFVFAVKASRFLTHMKKLKDPLEPWTNVITHAAELGPRLGPVLLQFPERWQKNLPRLEEFFDMASAQIIRPRIAVEFRNQSWFDDDVYSILEKYGAALCIADSDRFVREDRLTADFTYMRFHGRGQLYATSYTNDFLEHEAKNMKRLMAKGIDVYG